MTAAEFLSLPDGRIAYDDAGEGQLTVCIPAMLGLRSMPFVQRVTMNLMRLPGLAALCMSCFPQRQPGRPAGTAAPFAGKLGA